MTQKELNISKKYDDFYPKNYQKNNETTNQEKEMNQNIINKLNKNASFKEYIPKKRILNQQIHPLEKNKDSFYPKYKSKFFKEKVSKKEDKKEDKKENEIIEEEDEEDDYSGLAGNNYYNKNFKATKLKNKIKFSEDKNDFKAKWKTEMCHYWEMYGYCKFGDSCAFAHGSEELNKRKMSSNYKTKPCKQFFELGYCSYGVRCQFSHKLLKECEEINHDNEKKEVSYLKILSDFNNSSNQISHEVLKRPRLMTFENIASCSLDKTEKNRLELYGDILAVKKKENEEPDHVFSDDTNDENSEKIENNDKKDETINNDNGEEIEKNKRGRFISI